MAPYPGCEKNLRRYTSDEAREMQKLSAEKRKKNSAEKRLIKEEILKRMSEEDWEQIIDKAIKRAKESDKGFEVWRDTIGQKPVEVQEVIERPMISDDINE